MVPYIKYQQLYQQYYTQSLFKCMYGRLTDINIQRSSLNQAPIYIYIIKTCFIFILIKLIIAYQTFCAYQLFTFVQNKVKKAHISAFSEVSVRHCISRSWTPDFRIYELSQHYIRYVLPHTIQFIFVYYSIIDKRE